MQEVYVLNRMVVIIKAHMLREKINSIQIWEIYVKHLHEVVQNMFGCLKRLVWLGFFRNLVGTTGTVGDKST